MGGSGKLSQGRERLFFPRSQAIPVGIVEVG
jgi:hypothetical protein